MEHIFLTRRNLQTLLNKLNAVARGEQSDCTLIKQDNTHSKYPQTMRQCVVTAVEDADYYTDRIPGPVLDRDKP